MKMTTTFAALALAGSAFFSSQAFAADNVWYEDYPWGDVANATDYAEWNTFVGRRDATPQYGSNGYVNAQAGVFVTSTGNLYHFTNNDATYNFQLTSIGAVGDVFDVYLKVKTNGSTFLPTATLDGVSATKVTQFFDVVEFEGMGSGYVEEAYWVWQDVTITSVNQVFNFNAIAKSHVGLDQLALATVAVAAVPEPSAYGMMAIGLGILGFMGSRSRRKNIA
ncbi:PEP-CTERM sorting domain-containing protein [Methylobacillus sp. Pita2]|uniref:PEP-CTERM sorting domain-containing protein n=1 Tax=Methylobacillus sp. Pita2 TaxID=3383245 RepID=UPI0038B443A0